MDQRQRRPSKAAPPSPAPIGPSDGATQFAHGFCYLSPQSVLAFGSDRREPVSWRPVVSLRAKRGIRYVLPATTKPRADFFHLEKERCFVSGARPIEKDGYLAPWVEAVRLGELIELGVLPHPDRLAIGAWFQVRLDGGAR